MIGFRDKLSVVSCIPKSKNKKKIVLITYVHLNTKTGKTTDEEKNSWHH